MCLYINISIMITIENKTKKIQGFPAMEVIITINDIEAHGSL